MPLGFLAYAPTVLSYLYNNRQDIKNVASKVYGGLSKAYMCANDPNLNEKHGWQYGSAIVDCLGKEDQKYFKNPNRDKTVSDGILENPNKFMSNNQLVPISSIKSRQPSVIQKFNKPYNKKSYEEMPTEVKEYKKLMERSSKHEKQLDRIYDEIETPVLKGKKKKLSKMVQDVQPKVLRQKPKTVYDEKPRKK